MAEVPESLLHITRNLPPLQGGMERLNGKMAQALAAQYRVAVVGPAACRGELPESIHVAEVPLRPLALFLLLGLMQSLRQAWRMQPAIVLAGSGLTAPMAWLAARWRRSLCVAYVHGLDLVVDSLVYRNCWLPFIRRMDLVLVNSASTGRLAQSHGVPAERIRVLNPGTTLPAKDAHGAADFRRTNDFGNRPLLLSVGRLTARKGLREFVEICLPGLCECHQNILLVVIGDDARDALNAKPGSERARIADAAQRAGVADAVRFLPSCEDDTLSAAYAACDLHVFPVRELPGDVEGFGMVAIEAAAHGLPTVAFRAGGVPDAVIEGVTGALAESGDYVAFAGLVTDWLGRTRNTEVRDACRQASARWSWDKFGDRLHRLLIEARSMRSGQRL